MTCFPHFFDDMFSACLWWHVFRISLMTCFPHSLMTCCPHFFDDMLSAFLWWHVFRISLMACSRILWWHVFRILWWHVFRISLITCFRFWWTKCVALRPHVRQQFANATIEQKRIELVLQSAHTIHMKQHWTGMKTHLRRIGPNLMQGCGQVFFFKCGFLRGAVFV